MVSATASTVMILVSNARYSALIGIAADVKGAFMNGNIQSQEGLEVTDFPSGVPTYTGHFHKPHTVCIITLFLAREYCLAMQDLVFIFCVQFTCLCFRLSSVSRRFDMLGHPTRRPCQRRVSRNSYIV